jgi:hypothetical protein
MKPVLIGADPELFMKHPDSGDFISAHGRIPGTKWAPHKVPFGAVQVDGTALEFNIDPATNVHEFLRNLKAVRRTLTAMVPGYQVVAEPVAYYKPNYFKKEIPAYAQELGCNPDYNAWTTDTNPRPNAVGKPFRTASGHLHIGWTAGEDVEDCNHFLLCCRLARQLDYGLGMYSLLWDFDSVRRSLYGKAGAFRPKTYGLEYRVLSNRWLDSDPLIRWIYSTVQFCMADAFAGIWYEDKYGDMARKVIDNNLLNWMADSADFDIGLEMPPGVKVA